MSSFLPVFKISMRSLISAMFPRYRKSGRKSAGRTALYVALFAYVFVVLVGGMTAMFYGLARSLAAAGYGWMYFTLVGAMVIAMCVVSGLFLTHAQLFAARDNELLLSLPIRPGVILFSRIASLLTLDYLFTLLVSIPAAIVWALVNAYSAAGLVFLILSVLILPLPAMAVSMLIAWILSAIFSRVPGSNAFKLIVSLAFFTGYFYVVFNMNTYIQALMERGAGIAEAFRRPLFPLYHMGLAITEGRFGSFLLYALCALAPFGVMTALLSSRFLKIATTNRGARKAVYRQKPMRARSPVMAFAMKELRLLLSLPVYIINGALGGLLAVVLAVALSFRQDVLNQAFGQMQALLDVPSMAAAVLCLLSAMSLVSAASVSLEGNTLWIARSLPIASYDVLRSKVLSHTIACGGPMLLAALICAVSLSPRLFGVLALLVAPLALVVAMGYVGVHVNLRFPRLDWVTPAQPVKQGAAILVAMLLGGVLILTPGIIYVFLLSGFLPADMMIFFTGIVYIVLSVILDATLKTKGARLYEQLG